ncbi:response regulator [Syntrophorhabdus aromaticivorans]|uniref:Response regulator n=1 Tax=Syntrophorhabdus aromaticivorans TaxID=328301 RepID=A0A351U2Y7_9BACT|nr:response regulator [Syntrophorhabdus aromaticivorans]NLW34239.1 response regulator [Syntrophorhabdus aromaticivorans]HBA54318.1 response regulator [Syntrophorhabdus aromaticivorans]
MTKHDETFRILVVDDNKELREILEEYLRVEGNVTDGAANGREALAKHGENPYDLIVTDLNMPEVTGMELIRSIKRDNDDTEFIIVTGYASLDSVVEAVKMGAFGYIIKPFRMEELKVVVKNALDKVSLKKLNRILLKELKSLHDEIERYRRGANIESVEPAGKQMDNTEQILEEIEKIEKLAKGRLLID